MLQEEKQAETSLKCTRQSIPTPSNIWECDPLQFVSESLKLSKTESFSTFSWLSLRLGLLVKSVLLPSGSLRHAGRTTNVTCPCLPLTLLCSCSILYHLVSHLSAALLQAHLRRAGTISTPASGCCTLCSFCILSAARLVAATSALSVEEELLVGLPETSRQTVRVGTVMVPSCRAIH